MMGDTEEKGKVSEQVIENVVEQIANDVEEELDVKSEEKLVFRHNDSVKLKSYQKLHKKQHGRRSHKKANYVVDNDGGDKLKECEGNAEEFKSDEHEPNHYETAQDKTSSSRTKKVHYGGEIRVRSLSGVEEENSDESDTDGS